MRQHRLIMSRCLNTIAAVFVIGTVGCSKTLIGSLAVPIAEIKLPILASARFASGAGDAAYASGKVVLDGKCLYLVDKNQEKVFPVFSAPKVSFDQISKVLHVNGQQFNQNDILVYGNPTPFKLNPAQHKWLQAPDSSCDISHAVMITAANYEIGERVLQ